MSAETKKKLIPASKAAGTMRESLTMPRHTGLTPVARSTEAIAVGWSGAASRVRRHGNGAG